MRKITLVCREHHERGLCNVAGLYEIINRIRPEVAFLELPRSHMSRFFTEKTDSNLETTAVNRYLEGHEIELVPVDVFDVPERFFERNGQLHRRISANSPEYRKLMDRHYQYVAHYGFEYLNSEHCY